MTFVARNVGQIKHEFMIERMPIKFDAPGRPTESAAQGMTMTCSPAATGS